MRTFIYRRFANFSLSKKGFLLLICCLVSALTFAQNLDLVSLLDDANKRQTSALAELHKVQSDRLNSQQNLDDYNSGALKFSESEVTALKTKLKALKEQEKVVTEKYKAVFDEVSKLREIQAQPEQKRKALLAQMYPNGAQSTENTSSDPAKAATPTGTPPTTPPVAEKPKQDMRYFTVCETQFEGADEFSGKIRKDMMPELLFTHTEERMREFLKDKDYISCTAQLSSLTGGYIFLTLKITVLTAEAGQSFGMIEKGSTVTFKLINESAVKLINSRTDIGKIDKVNNTTVYTVTYPILSSDLKMLRENEIDKMRIIWGSGYEDYDIYNVDVIMRQIKCLYAD